MDRSMLDFRSKLLSVFSPSSWVDKEVGIVDASRPETLNHVTRADCRLAFILPEPAAGYFTVTPEVTMSEGKAILQPTQDVSQLAVLRGQPSS